MSRGYPQLEMEPVYGFSHAIICDLFQMFFRGDTAGTANLPKRGGYIVASNHVSYVDPPIVGLHLQHQVCFFTRKSLWKPGLPARWLDAVGAIPVERDSGDVGAIKRIFMALGRGRVVILFPEGTRSATGELQPPKPGIGLVASKTGVPVVPARVFGSREAFGKGGGLRLGTPVSVSYGRPLLPEDYDNPSDGRERYQRVAERIMAAIGRLEAPRTPIV